MVNHLLPHLSVSDDIKTNEGRKKKIQNLFQVPDVPSSFKWKKSTLEKKMIAFHDEHLADDTKNKGSNNQPFFSPLAEFVTTDVGRAGAIFQTDDSTLPVYVKTPMSEMTTPLFQKKILCIFEKFEDEYKTPQQRGQSRCIGLESHNLSYIAIGKHANRGGKGIVNSKMKLLHW